MPVLRRSELEESSLADLHTIASELGLESFRSMRKADLISAIVGEQGGEPEAADPEPVAAEPEPEVAEPTESAAPDEPEPVEVGGPTDEPPVSDEGSDDDEDEKDDSPSPDAGETTAGVLDILANGSGFLRVGAPGHGSDDVYVSPAQTTPR